MKIWNPKRYHDRFQTLDRETTPKRHQKLRFQTLKDTTSTPTILPYKNPIPGRVMCTGKEIKPVDPGVPKRPIRFKCEN